MFLQLGSIQFDKAKSPNAISETLDASYAEHALINQATRLQPTGRELKELKMDLYLHRDFSKVQADIDALELALTTYEILPLLWGTGVVAGNFVITSLQIEKNCMSGFGDLYAANVSIALKEFVSNKVADQQAKADKKAFATGSNKAVTSRKAGSGTTQDAQQESKPCNQFIADAVSKLKAQAHQVQLQHDYFQNNVGDFTASRFIGPSISRPALQARNTATGLAKDHFACIRFVAASEVLQVQQTAQALADEAARPPSGLPATWWASEATRHTAFQNAVTAFVNATKQSVAKAVSRSGD